MMNLREKTASGMVWVSITSWTIQIITLGTSIVLARLLEPNEFGLVALSMIIISLCNILSQSGLGGALIQRSQIDQKSTDTAFILTASIGLFLTAAVFLAAPLSVFLFKETRLVPIVRWMSLNILIASLMIVPSNLLEREMAYRKKLWVDIAQAVSYAIVAVGGALLGLGVWSLVTGTMISLSLQTILTWKISQYRPKGIFDRGTASELWGFGKHLVLASLLLFAAGNADGIYIGRFLTASSVGIYGLAMNISDLPTDFLGRLFNRVMFPAFAIVQTDLNKLKTAFLTSLRYISYIAFPASFGLFALADPAIRLIYGEKWISSIPLVHILCIYGLFRSLGSLTGALFTGTGKPEIPVRLLLLRLITLGILIFSLGKPYALAGVAASMSLSMIISVISSFVLINRYLKIDFLNLSRQFFPQLIAAIIMFGSIAGLSFIIHSPLHQVLVFIPVGVIIYSLSIWFFTRGLVKDDLFEVVKPLSTRFQLSFLKNDDKQRN